jgi:signal transduction histidine kinase
MTISANDVLEALLWSAVAGLAVWFLLLPVRRRTYLGLLVSLVLTGTAASTGALYGGMHSMLVPMLGYRTVIVLTALSVAVAVAAAIAAARSFARDAQALRRDVAQVADGTVPSADGRRLMNEVAQVRQELRASAETLAATRERERALESARRDLVSWVSHDLRTPLAGLRAMAEALEDGVVDNPEQYYKQIGASVERLNQMVEDLFDLSRIQAGVVSREVENISLDDLVSDCIAALEPLAAAQDVRLTGAVSGATAISGNGPELNRALTNLVANAIRHTHAHGAVDVRVGLTPVGPDGAIAEVLVRDECGGIPEEHLHRVFDVGFRGEAARTSNGKDSGGAGLGLAITRGIVEAHAGTVEVSNRPGGCQFRVRLPAGRAAE